jgi:hypothetical protein
MLAFDRSTLILFLNDATALVYSVPLASANGRDFHCVPGLIVIDT